MAATTINNGTRSGGGAISDRGDKRFAPDRFLFGLTLILVALGVSMVFDASYPLAYEMYGDGMYFFKKQALWAVIGLGAMLLMSRISYWKLARWAFPLLLVTFAALIAVHIPHIGHDAQGATRWIGYGPIRIQPSEFAKFAIVLYLARVIAARPRLMGTFWTGVFPRLLIALGLVVLVERQPDMGTAITILLVVLLLFYTGGMRIQWLAALLAVFSVCALGVVLHQGTDGYRWKRVTTFVNPDNDPLNTGYQIRQSLLAFGTGGPTGVGFGESRQKRRGSLPAQRTDFIFAIIGEEFGLVGTGVVMTLFLVLCAKGFDIARRTRDPQGSLIATGLTGIIAVQWIVNVAVVTASIPATGVPLPFFSYGGSSLVLTLMSVGVLLNISQHPYRRSEARRRLEGASD